MTTEEIKNQISKMSIEERASLVSYILHDLPAPSFDVTDAEVVSRCAELDSGAAQEMDHETLVHGITRNNR